VPEPKPTCGSFLLAGQQRDRAAADLVRTPPAWAAEGQLETTTVRLAKNEGICIAPQYIADELLRTEGFTDITGTACNQRPTYGIERNRTALGDKAR
jgi:hypothetical protein